MKKTLGISALLGLMLCSSLLGRNVTTWDHKFYIHINDKKYVNPKSSGNNYRWESTGNISILSQRSWECQIQATSRVGDGTLKIYDPYNSGLCETINVQIVELKFKEDPTQFYGFYENESSRSNSMRYYKSVKFEDMDTLIASFDKPIVDDKMTMYLSPDTGISSTSSISKNDQKVLLQSKSGTGNKGVFYTGSYYNRGGSSNPPVLGTLNVCVYKERKINIKVVPIKLASDSSAPSASRFTNLAAHIKKIYKQVCFETSYTVLPAVTFNDLDFGYSQKWPISYLDNIEQHFPAGSDDFYVFVVYNLRYLKGVNSSVNGFARGLGSKYAYILAENNPASMGDTVAHEVGHLLGMADNYDSSYMDNLMYGYGSRTNTKLYYTQWNAIGVK